MPAQSEKSELVMLADGSSRRRAVSKSKRSGLMFPVSRVGKNLKKGRFAKQIGSRAAIIMTATMQYLVEELLTATGPHALSKTKKGSTKSQTIKPRHLMLAVSEDEGLTKLLGNVTIAGAGVRPNVHDAIADPTGSKKAAKEDVDKKTKKKKKKKGKKDQKKKE